MNPAWLLDLATFAYLVSGGAWRPYRVSRYIARLVSAAAMRNGGRLLLNVPPRHGKSEITSFWLPQQVLALYPEKHIILCSYEAGVAQRWSRKVRDSLVQHRLCEISETASAAHSWETIQGGGMTAAGVGGPITGLGGDVLIIDDPHKNWDEAHSPAIQTKIWDWYQSTFLSRLEPAASVIVNMTRWCKGDLCDRIEHSELPAYQKIRLAAVAKENDPLGRRPGEALMASRYPVRVLEQIPQNAIYRALWDQDPVDDEGGQIWHRDWFRTWRYLPIDLEEWIQSWDPKGLAIGRGSYVCGQVWAKRGVERYLVDQWRSQQGLLATMAQIRLWRERYPQARRIYVEAAADGSAILQTMGIALAGLIGVTPKGSKVARAAAVSAEIQSGCVYLPSADDQTWVAGFLNEVEVFPGGADDQVDTASQALQALQRKQTSIVPQMVAMVW